MAYISDDVIATFSGPTYDDYESYLPNNGFYFKGSNLKTDFCDTNPPGERRGAFGFTLRGGLNLLTDEEKWSVVRNRYKDYRVLVGTSFYFENGDSVFNIPARDYYTRSILSYLIQYQNISGEKRNCFAVSDTQIMRIDMKKAIDDYMERVGGLSYRAVELEFTGSTCITRNNADYDRYGGYGFYRRDHYVVMLNGK